VYWAPDAWQDWINRLLKMRYGFRDYVQVPDQVSGDFGIEGFSADGCAFQCYAPEEPLTVAERNKKHKRKISRDLDKFAANHAHLAKLFGLTKISHWILVVPQYEDKQVLAYAEEKAAKIRELELPCTTDAFAVRVVDASYFEAETRSLSGSVKVPDPPVTPRIPSDIQDWSDSNSEHLQVLSAKLGAITFPTPAKRWSFVNKIIDQYLSGENILRGYHEAYPQIAEAIVENKQARASSLAIESDLTDLASSQFLLTVHKQYVEQLRQEVPGLPATTANLLGWEAVVEWLFTCPLELRTAC
jgi:hypothetical protein